MTLALIFALVLAELLFVGWTDFKTQKISNNWIAINFVVSIILHFTFQTLYPLSWEVLIFPLGFILMGFFLYLFHVMGAGDSKFLASLFLIIPLEYHLVVFEKLVLSTVVTGSCLLTYRVIKNHHTLRVYLLSRYWDGIKQTIKSRFSYAPVILVAWILFGFNLWK